MSDNELLCPVCKGSGEGWVMSDSSPDGHNILVDCQECNGRGSLLGAYESMKSQLNSLNDRHVAAGGDLVFMRTERDRLKAENDALRKDSEKLNWLDKRRQEIVDNQSYSQPEGEVVAYHWFVEAPRGNVRDAIDDMVEREFVHE